MRNALQHGGRPLSSKRLLVAHVHLPRDNGRRRTVAIYCVIKFDVLLLPETSEISVRISASGERHTRLAPPTDPLHHGRPHRLRFARATSVFTLPSRPISSACRTPPPIADDNLHRCDKWRCRRHS